ncbi:YhgE/Pip family protein [Bifidobacterium simiiventris]|uniref:YhgE/Pip family protein n=1 Tax=Bifidobacterium simiiventris TaxID=2834434 RepID=UPI001C59ECED|nr:YhgE/Pip domain-containing protein [Bifidobacterium simiiventris]
MNAIIKLFVGDLKRITGNVVSIIIVIGLVTIPGLFSWFNIAASWDPFSNTGNLKFAVASVDEGYQSDLIPVKITVGDSVVNALRANSQLDWTFTSESDAIDGTKSGEYYAAVIIPKDFSEKMMTFFTADTVRHAKLTYYTNEKINALAPKVTGQGADQVAAQVNEMFAQTITSTALSIASGLLDQLDDPQATQMLGTFNTKVGDVASALDDTAATLTMYGTLTDSAASLMASSIDLIDTASGSAQDAKSQLDSAKSGAATVSDALSSATSAMADALKTSADSFDAVSANIDAVYASAGKSSADLAQSLRAQAGNVDGQRAQYQSIRDTVAALDPATTIGSDTQAALLDGLDRVIARQVTLRDALNDAAGDLETKNTDATAKRQTIKDLAAQAKSSVTSVTSDFSASLTPQIDSLSTSVNDLTQTLSSGSSSLSATIDDLHDTADTANAKLADVKSTLNETATTLTSASAKLSDFSEKMKDALNSGDMAQVKELLGSDTDSLAATLAAPVQLKRKALFPVANFGSSLAPLYTFLPLWVGSLLMAVTLKTSVSRRVRDELEAAIGREARPHELYLGHYGVFATIALLQSTVSCGGTLLFMRIQAVHPWLFMLDGWVSSLVYSFFAYTMVVSFGNVGKAIGVLYLVVQICGSGAAYPLQILPDFVSTLSPWLPITHSVTMVRAAIAGIYANDYWIALGKLALFVPPLLLLGLLLRKPLVGFNKWYVAQVESTKLL